jgi:hypothetical protein
MDFPSGVPDLIEAKARMAHAYAAMEAHLLRQVDILAKSGLADARLLAIARTDVEKAFMAIAKALMTGGPSGREYGKIPMPEPMPQAFTPPAGDERRFDAGAKDATGEPRRLPHASDFDHG